MVRPGSQASLYSIGTEADPILQVAGQLIEVLLSARIGDSVREAAGASDDASASFEFDYEPDSIASVMVLAQGDPQRMSMISDTVQSEITDLVANGVRADEMANARSVVSADLAFYNNKYLIDQVLAWAERPDEPIADLVGSSTIAANISAADINAAIDLLLADSAHIEIIRVPAG